MLKYTLNLNKIQYSGILRFGELHDIYYILCLAESINHLRLF